MLPWKERLYAFLLRRVLGPWLDERSLELLHQSVEVSLQEGSLVLKQVGLNTEFVTKKLLKNRTVADNNWRISQATLERLDISLSLEQQSAYDESGDRGEEVDVTQQEGSFSLAWRAATYSITGDDGSSSSSSNTKIALVAKVVLAGLVVHVEPDDGASKDEHNDDSQSNSTQDLQQPDEESSPSGEYSSPTASSSFSSYLSSYLDAALSSLRLSVQLNNMTIRLQSRRRPAEETKSSLDGSDDLFSDLEFDEHRRTSPWIELRVKSASYHDVDENSRPTPSMTATNQSSSYSTVMHKSLDLTKVSISVGYDPIDKPKSDDGHCSKSAASPSSQRSTTIILLDGVTKVRLRAVEYESQDSSPRRQKQRPQIQNDLELLGDRLFLFVDHDSLNGVNRMVEGLRQNANHRDVLTEQKQSRHNDGDDTPAYSSRRSMHTKACVAGQDGSLTPNHFSDFTGDEADVKALEGIVEEQYREARLRAERNEVRGGLLLPSATKDGDVSFDAFFDANDQSFYHYSHMLSQSQISSGSDMCDDGSFVHSKLRCHLVSGQAKVVFSSSAKSRTSENAYLLMSISDVQASSALSNISTNHNLSVAHIEVENARAPASAPQSLNVSSVLSFPTADNQVTADVNDESTDMDNSTGEALLHAPCLSISVATRKSNMEKSSTVEQRRKDTTDSFSASSISGSFPKCNSDSTNVDVDVDIEPFVISCPVSLLNSVSTFIDNARPNEVERDIESTNPPAQLVSKEDDQSTHHLSLRCSCAHFDIAIPLEVNGGDGCADLLRRLCDRAGVPVSHYFLNQSAIGFHVERFSILGSDRGTPSSEESAFVAMDACFNFQHSLLYFYQHGEKERRLFDIITLSGETNPAFLRMSKLSREARATSVDEGAEALRRDNEEEEASRHPALKMFPVAPAISSFKAFQEDEDEESDEFKLSSRQEIRGSDPQPRMMDAAAKANMLIELDIPQIFSDMTIDEIVLLAEIVAKLHPHHEASISKAPQTKQVDEFPASEEFSAIGISLKSVRLAIHGYPIGESPVDTPETRCYSYLLHFNGARAHLLKNSRGLQHVRALAHDCSLSEAVGLTEAGRIEKLKSCLYAEEREEAVRRRAWVSPTTILTPIIHRSHLFTPISRKSPVILFDLLDLSGNRDSSQKSLSFTLYDLTHRYDYDSQWISRAASMASNLSTRMPKSNSHDEAEAVVSDSLTRFFFCIADCNIDYTSPCRWQTSSRTILRLGEVRLSSNLVRPTPSLQSIKLAVGDVSLYLCNSRFPYKFEDSRMFASRDAGYSEEVPLQSQTAEKVQRDMNFKTILMLDALDSVLTISDGSTQERDSRPRTTLNVSAGELSLFACKDSFALFTSSIGELCAEACALKEENYQELKRASERMDVNNLDDAHPDGEEVGSQLKDTLPSIRLEDLVRQSALRPALGTASSDDSESSFLLDGYDWTTIDQDFVNASGIPNDDEQSAKWYGSEKKQTRSIYRTGSHDESESPREKNTNPFQIISHHFPLQPTSDPLGDGDMGASKYAGTGFTPLVKTRVMVSDLSIKLRLFDGYDWPESLEEQLRNAERKGSFLIDLEPVPAADEAESNTTPTQPIKNNEADRKAALMASLLDGGPDSSEPSRTFQDILLPEERKARLKAQAEVRRLGRRSDKYFQFSASGIQVRNDSMLESETHRLASCLDLKLQDFFAAETISSSKPIKLAGEWFSDFDHPRDTRDGLFMMKMVTWNAKRRVAPDGRLVNDECEASIKILPLRCFLDQKAIRFVGAFFRSDSPEESSEDGKESESDEGLPDGLYAIPPPTFVKFVCKPLKLKVNYKPEKLDQEALRNGQIVELLNLSPLESLVITLEQVEVKSVVGFGEVLGVLIPTWIQHVSSTQLIKFLEYSQPLEPLTQIGGGFSDMVILPLEAIRKGGNIKQAFKAGANSFGLAFAYQTLTLASSAAEMVAAAGGAVAAPGEPGNLLPSRPLDVPSGMTATATHVVESLSRGFQAANTRIVIIPFREYQRSGTTGLMTSVVRGIPVAITAPASGAAEAISYALIGMRNSIRPDIRRELETTQRGLRYG